MDQSLLSYHAHTHFVHVGECGREPQGSGVWGLESGLFAVVSVVVCYCEESKLDGRAFDGRTERYRTKDPKAAHARYPKAVVQGAVQHESDAQYRWGPQLGALRAVPVQFHPRQARSSHKFSARTLIRRH